MKQTIREKTFETNSSSYHTLTIQKIKGDIPRKEIEKNKDLVINTNINYKTIGYTGSYNYIGRGTYEKAQLVLRFMGYRLEEQIDDAIEKYRSEWDFNGNYDYAKMKEYGKKEFWNTSLIKAFVKAIKRYIGEEYKVDIQLNRDYSPFIDTVSDDDKSVYEIFEISKKDFNDVDKLADRFYEIIFDKNIEVIEELESNE